MTDVPDDLAPAAAPVGLTRRGFLERAGATGVLAVAGSLWGGAALARPAGAALRRGAGAYGPLRAPNADGLCLPDGFTSRVVARSGAPVGPSSYRWHGAPDGGACFAGRDGSWTYVSNSELATGGGAGSISFAADGRITGARRILSGTRANCAGGATGWGTWLSCEETARGWVFECDPLGRRAPVRRPAMGAFTHEAAACDPVRKVVYLTEDETDGCLYRFRPRTWGDLSAGELQVLCRLDGALAWRRVADPAASTRPTRYQVPGALRFDGGEGCWYADGSCWFTAKGEGRVWQYLASASPARLGVLYDARRSGGAALSGVDNITGTTAGELLVAEDGGNMEVCALSARHGVAPLLRLVGHDRSEITGPAMSPDGTRLYFSSQRGSTGTSRGGVTFEVRGPFRR